MAPSRPDARPSPQAMAPAGSRPFEQSRTASLSDQAARQLIALAVLERTLTSRRFYQALAVGAIVLTALGRIGKENQASTLARLAAWDERQIQRLEREAQRLERKAQRQGRAVMSGRQMIRSRAAKGLVNQHQT